MSRIGVVNVSRLNLREGPDLSTPIVSVLTRGTVLDVVGDSGESWLFVRPRDGGPEGYLARAFIQVSEGTLPGVISIGREGEVTAQGLNVRSGPGMQFPIVLQVGQGTRMFVVEQQGDWLRVRVNNREGFVAARFVDLTPTPSGFLRNVPDLYQVGLEPTNRIPAQAAGTASDVIARTWNRYGGLLEVLADLLNIPVNTVVAVLAAESDGEAFGPNFRMIIRFEIHIFHRYWGQNNQALFEQHFMFSPISPWRDHRWRAQPEGAWEDFHGDQNKEWVVFSFARRIADNAAMLSISMGAPQIMGFNFSAIGYSNVLDMFDAFGSSVYSQLIGIFDFIKGPGVASPALRALQRRDYLAFATIYNGSGRAQVYAGLIQRYVSIFDTLIATTR